MKTTTPRNGRRRHGLTVGLHKQSVLHALRAQIKVLQEQLKDQQTVGSIASRQRDDALKQLNDRANIDQTFRHLHNSIGELHSAMEKMRAFARFFNQLSVWGGPTRPTPLNLGPLDGPPRPDR